MNRQLIDFKLRWAHPVFVKRVGSSPVVTVLLALLLAWHGVLAGLPHTHHEDAAPKYVVHCDLSGTGSPDSHFHTISHLLEAGVCLSCLVAGSSAGIRAQDESFTYRDIVRENPQDFSAVPRTHHQAPLPDNRGPPLYL